jgi:hypothetical protein
MRSIGLDVHRDFCEVAIGEDGGVRLAGRVKTKPDELELFAASLGAEDEVVLEATGNALAIARIIEPHVARVVLAHPKAVQGADADGSEDGQGRRARAGEATGGRFRAGGVGS